MARNEAELQFARNMGGTFTPDCRERINRYVRCPCWPCWEDCFSIILNRQMMTLWQAVLIIDPTFPHVGRKVDQHGKVLSDWDRIPTIQQIQEAIYYATH